MEALSQVHSDAAKLEWVVGGYSSKDVLDVIATGTEGTLDAVSPYFASDTAAFALIRYPLLMDDKSNNVRFVFIDWTPDTMNPMKKAMVSVHKGQIRAMFEPFHIDLVCSDRSDIDEQQILKRMGLASGTYSAVVADSKEAPLRNYNRSARNSATSRPASLPPQSQSTDQVNFSEDLKSFLELVRDGTNSWAIAGYNSDGIIVPQQSGQEGLEELLVAMDRNQVQYALASFSEARDEKATTQRFIYISQLPSSLSPMKRGKYSIHSGTVSAFFKPFHFEFSVGSADELSSSKIQEHTANLSGSKSHIVERAASPRTRSASSSSRLSFGAPNAPATVKFAAEQEELIKSGIQAVHSDLGGCDWLSCKLTDKDELCFLAQGQGGYDQLVEQFEQDCIHFALLRVSDQIDRYLTTKFVLVMVVPEGMSPLRRARFGTTSGAVKDLFRPFHVDLVVGNGAELNEKEIQMKVGNASGSHSNVVQRV